MRCGRDRGRRRGLKEILGLTDGYRESTQSWRELLLDLKRRGFTRALELAIGDGALGFWAALREVIGNTREQRCWVHKTGNVPNAMPKSVQPKAKGHLHDIHWPTGHCVCNVPCTDAPGVASGFFDFDNSTAVEFLRVSGLWLRPSTSRALIVISRNRSKNERP